MVINVLRSFLLAVRILLSCTLLVEWLAAAAPPAVNPPVITRFTPTSGTSFTLATGTGADFTGATAVQFDGVAADSLTVISDTEIRTQAPVGVTPGPISVSTPNGVGTSAVFFIPPAVLTDFTPIRDAVGASIQITGQHFVFAYT